MPRMTSLWSRCLGLLWIAGCSESAGHPSHAKVREEVTVSAWPVGEWDVDCASMLPNHTLSSDDDCAALDRMPGGAALADELYRRLMWSMFVELNADSARWRGQDAFIFGGDGPPAASNAECVMPSASELEVFQEPPWQGEDWLDAGLPSAPTAHPPDSPPLWDQRGNPVQFEVAALHQAGFGPSDAGAGLETVQGQLADMCLGDLYVRSTNWGSPPTLHLKLAWRRIHDDQECLDYGFITRSGNACAAGELGLVAMHIAAKTFSQGDFWLWGTFSHVNNVEGVEGDGGQASPPLFRDPSCAADDCPDNTCPRVGGTKRRTQVARVRPIPDVVARTKQDGVRLGRISAEFARYDLLGIQRVLQARDPNAALLPPVPESLANEIIEWDRQDSSCIGCHARARVASVPGADLDAAKDCRRCDAGDGGVGLCFDNEVSSVCRDCRAVERMSRYHWTNDRAYPVADMTWIYDHFWPQTGETP
jgi:hypothetical protein